MSLCRAARELAQTWVASVAAATAIDSFNGQTSGRWKLAVADLARDWFSRP